ncbi:hypothetical protein TNCV_4090551 [Trichonephila clavipes]|uniref:Uncharacterized protein n=1 Tax=Trichonephila clavipes TaxID=2585209 RepID=A0A8X6VGG9_TRICX|nr:hypothetical protein TNCV_4090551 [Trichonephila clavipes]
MSCREARMTLAAKDMGSCQLGAMAVVVVSACFRSIKVAWGIEPRLSGLEFDAVTTRLPTAPYWIALVICDPPRKIAWRAVDELEKIRPSVYTEIVRLVYMINASLITASSQKIPDGSLEVDGAISRTPILLEIVISDPFLEVVG